MFVYRITKKYKGKEKMIVYKIDIMEALKQKGYTSYRLRQNKIFGEATMTKFRKKEYINFENLNLLCKLLECQPGDIIRYDGKTDITDEDKLPWEE